MGSFTLLKNSEKVIKIFNNVWKYDLLSSVSVLLSLANFMAFLTLQRICKYTEKVVDFLHYSCGHFAPSFLFDAFSWYLLTQTNPKSTFCNKSSMKIQEMMDLTWKSTRNATPCFNITIFDYIYILIIRYQSLCKNSQQNCSKAKNN